MLTDDTTERALAYAPWNTEHIAKLSVQRNTTRPTLSDGIRHSNVTATPIATTRNWYCRGQYTAGSGDRIPPQRDTLSCTKSRQPRNEGHISLFRLFIVHNMQSSPITRLQGTEMRHARSTHPKAQGRARVGQQSTRTHKPRTRTCGWLHAKHAQHNRQQQAQQLLTDDTTERALAYAPWNIEHIANSRCNDNRNSTLWRASG